MLYLFDRWEVLRFFFFNLRWWIEEYKFDGYRFDGVILMLYYIYGMGRFLVYLGNEGYGIFVYIYDDKIL